MFDLKLVARTALEPLRRALPVDVETAVEQGRVQTRSVEGVKVKWLTTNAGDEIQAQQLRYGYYELPELQRLRADLGPRQVILDIGANIGNHSIFFLQHFSCRALMMVEPYPAAMKHLLANLSLNYRPSVELMVLPIALGAKTTSGSITPPTEFNIGLTRIDADSSGDVEIRTGDEIIGKKPVELIKIDVEGMELGVLQGLSDTLKNHRPALYVEVSQHSRTAVLDYIDAAGYTVVRECEAYQSQSNLTAVPSCTVGK